MQQSKPADATTDVGSEQATASEAAVTLPAPVDELTFYEDSEGLLYAEHAESGELYAFDPDGSATSIDPALVNPESDGLDAVDTLAARRVANTTVEQTGQSTGVRLSGGD